MTPIGLIGTVASAYLARQLAADDAGDGTARFLLDRLTGPQVAAICESILGESLTAQIRMRIPRDLVEGLTLPAEVLTDERTTHWRNAECDRPVLLLANTDEDQGQSLKDITRIGSTELLGEPDIWVQEASHGLGLTDQHLLIWAKALKGLQDSRPSSLDNFAHYVLKTRSAIEQEGLAVIDALGWALPSLRAPRDTALFHAISERTRTHAHAWKRVFNQVFTRRAPYLLKVTPSQQPIGTDQLADMWAKVRCEVAPSLHSVFEAFIQSPSKWSSEAEALSQFEWERDNVKLLFDGLKPRTFQLGEATSHFYEDELPESLTADEQEYLADLDKRRTREPNERDEEFYERHRIELGADRKLKSRWDRFVYGQPIETDDFAIGVLRCLERLFESAGTVAARRSLKIEAHKNRPRDWLDLNYDAVVYFSRRYRGLRSLTRKDIEWIVGDLFDFERVVERQEKRGRFQREQSSAKAANQIRFYVTLEQEGTAGADAYSVQLIWQFNPDGINREFAEDWERLTRQPLLLSRVSREPVSKKGKLQAIDLSDVSTLMAVFRQDRGSLVKAYNDASDLALIVPKALQKGLDARLITDDGHRTLLASWKAFEGEYATAIKEFFDEGASATSCLNIDRPYKQLLDDLHKHAPGDSNRRQIWEPILQLGTVPVDGGATASIVAPWHPLRLLAMAVKGRQLAGLIHHLLTADSVDFGDSRLFFRDLAEELAHPYFPDICIGAEGAEVQLLSRVDTYGDYSLMESPIGREIDDDATDENPNATARELLQLVQRYLTLQPHESANMSIVLYNCNSARLPEATVNVLGELYEEEDEEVRCQVILRHHDATRLHELYEKILEGSDRDVDSFVASEASRDFMARLRIGIMADSAPIPNPQDGPPIDIVFLQDVIARLAELVWLDEPLVDEPPTVLEHVPPRCSRRRPGTMDDQRSVVYLTSPIQPEVGWHYLRAIHGLLQGTETPPGARPLPARQISFQHNQTRAIFEEVHRLGQWVVNSDDLLTRRQLRNQGVQIIRHQQHRYDDRSLTISSKAPLNLLEVLVSRRLGALNLGLSDANLQRLTRRMVEDASLVSGDIVLRAARRGEFASELIGVVLSKFILEQELGAAELCGWYFLDDYAEWLGQKEQHLADLMALSPQDRGGRKVLVVGIGESKYVTSAALGNCRRTSAVQLRETLERMQEALFGNPSRLDRDLWLSRLADVILDGIEVPPTQGALLHEWRDAIRSGEAEILLKGYSHVFVPVQQPEEGDPSERAPVAGVENAWQEVFGRDRVRELVLAYQEGGDTKPVRERLGDDSPWDSGTPRRPSGRVSWAAAPRPQRSRAKGKENGESAERARDEGETKPPTEQTTQTPEQDVQRKVVRAEREPSLPVHGFDWAGAGLRPVLAKLATAIPPATDDEAWLREVVNRLRTALLSYGLQARVEGQRLTPNTALIRFHGSDRLRVADVERRRNELLTTHGLQVTSVLAEPAQVVICVARPNRQIVSLVEAWRNRVVDQIEPRVNQSLVVGVRESDGELLYLRPGTVHAPHTLVAGTTGSGKSVLIQNLLIDIAATNDSKHAKIILIDPKQGADYLELQGLPHLQGEIIVTQDAAHAALEAAVQEMERRYQVFRAAGVANLARFNAAAAPADQLPVLWVFHDEFAVWMLVEDYREIVSSTVQRLGVMARAAGIFLVFAAQRPEDRVMPVQLRDNLGNRLVLRVESPGTSMIALGEEGAERLLGRGHLAARLQGEDAIAYAQVPILASDQIAAIVEAIRTSFHPPRA